MTQNKIYDGIYDVIIVGAGISGLIAARELGKGGLSVLILESQNRAGGRIDTIKTTTGYPIDTGAYFLNGRGDVLNPNPLLLSFSLETKPIILSDALVYEEENNSIREMTLNQFLDKHHIDEYQSQIYQKVNQLKKKLNRNHSNTLLKTSDNGKRNNKKQSDDDAKTALKMFSKTKGNVNKKKSQPSMPSVAEVFQYTSSNIPELGTDEFIARQLMTAMLMHNTGGHLSDISFLELEKQNQFNGPLEFVLNGCENSILKPLLKSLDSLPNVEMMLNKPVHAIHHELNPSKVKVVTHDGDHYLAAAVLCTVPLGVLKEGNISFYPSLSLKKQQAIEHLKIGKQIKIILEFEKVFWPENVPFLYPGSDNIDEWPEYLNLYYFSNYKTPTLVYLVYNDDIPLFSHREHFIEQALAPLRKIFKEKMSPLKFAKIAHDYSADQNSLGALSFLGTHYTNHEREHLQTPENGTLYFAGPHTENDTLEGAYESGLRSALQITAKFKADSRYIKRSF